jgi:hypothetical protein
MGPKEFATSQRDAPKDMAGVLDESAQTLFLTELWRGLGLTLKVFFEPGVTVRQPPEGQRPEQHRQRGPARTHSTTAVVRQHTGRPLTCTSLYPRATADQLPV